MASDQYEGPDRDPQPDPGGRLLGGKYRLGRVLGEGGMGAVYEAEHVGLGIKVAVKLLNEIFASDPSSVTRFRREARAAAAIRHENIVTVHDTGTDDDGIPFIVMELLQGESLSALIRRERVFAPLEAAHIACQLLAGLAAAHARGVIHRDLKPGNVLVCQLPDGVRQVKILDFGISKFFADAAQNVTVDGAVVGTPRFMAPEQARADADLDARADLYAVGVLLYRMLTGKLPFSGRSQEEVIEQTILGKVVPLRALRAELSAELEAVVLRAMAKERCDRFPDAVSFIEALRGTLPELPRFRLETAPRVPFASDPILDVDSAVSEPARTVRDSPRARGLTTPQPRRRRGARLAVGALILLVAVGGGIALARWLMGPATGEPRADAAAAGRAAQPAALRFGISSNMPSRQLEADLAPLQRHLAQQLGRPVVLRIEDDLVDLATKLAGGELDVAELTACDYARAKRRYPLLRLLATHVTAGGSSYRGAILVRADSDVRRLADLRNRPFCFTHRKSCSSYVYPRALFRQHGIDPDRDLSQTRITRDHVHALRELHSKACDGAAVVEGLLNDVRRHGVAAQDFRILEKTDPIPNDAYCASHRLAPELAAAVRKALLSLSPNSAAARRVLGERSYRTGFLPVTEDAYRHVLADGD